LSKEKKLETHIYPATGIILQIKRWGIIPSALRDSPDSLWLRDSSTNASNFTAFVFNESQIPRPCQLFWRDCSSCVSSFILFALNESHNRFAPGI